MRKISLLLITLIIFCSISFADVFENITYQMPQNHYNGGIRNLNGHHMLQLYSNDISSSDNIVIQITPSDKNLGYMSFSDAELKKHKSLLEDTFVNSVKNASNSDMAKLLGVSALEFSSEITAYKNSIRMLSCERVEITKHNAPAIKYIIYSEFLNIPFVQTGYCFPNGKNYYYITFTGDYTNNEMNSFLSSISITDFVEKSDLWGNIKKAVVVSLIFVMFQTIKEKYKKIQESKKKTEIPPDDYIYDPSLSDIKNQKNRFSQMDISTLEDLIKNKKDEYTEETYAIALEQYKLRSEEVPKTSREDELKLKISQLDEALANLTQMLSQAKKDLGNLTIEDAENMYRQNLISEAQKNEMINSIEALQMTINLTPNSIAETQKLKAELEQELSKIQS